MGTTDSAPDSTVYIVDDDEAIRDSLELLMDSVGLKAASYGSAESFLDDINQESQGCLLLDLRMPGTNGVEVQERLAERDLDMPVIVVSAHGDVPMAVSAMKAGAMDFVEKPFNEQQLLERVQEALAEHRRRCEARSERRSFESKLERLSKREREVLELVIQGKSSKLIARELGISRKTVDVHRSRIMEKTGVRSSAQLVGLLLTLREA